MMANKDFLLKINMVAMENKHLREVFELAQEANLSYWSYEDYKSEIVRENSCCLAAEDANGKLTGFLVARLIMTERYAELNNIAVKSDYRRFGVGRNLIESLVKISKINNLDKILLEFRESNKSAYTFYLSLGFESLGKRKDFYQTPSEDGITMVKYLTKPLVQKIKKLDSFG